MVLGTIFIAGGAVLIAIFGIVPEPTHSLDDLLVLFGRPAFIAYFSLLGAAVLACLIIVRSSLLTLHILSDQLDRRISPNSAFVDCHLHPL